MSTGAPRAAVLITGAGGGIGAATGRRFAAAGADLALCDRQPIAELDELRELARAHGGRLLHRTLDVADREGVAAFVRQAEEELGRLDVLVTTAGILASIPAEDLSWEQWDRFPTQLVYAENGSAVRLVMMNGEVVVEDGRCTRIDEDAVLDEAREVLGAYLKQHALVEDDARELEPYFRAVYERCAAEHENAPAHEI